jgi:hypothetical protein
MSTLGAYRLLACNDEQDLSHALAPFLHRKQAVCPKSGYEADNVGVYTNHAKCGKPQNPGIYMILPTV